jgi:hypothetical protein
LPNGFDVHHVLGSSESISTKNKKDPNAEGILYYYRAFSINLESSLDFHFRSFITKHKYLIDKNVYLIKKWKYLNANRIVMPFKPFYALKRSESF